MITKSCQMWPRIRKEIVHVIVPLKENKRNVYSGSCLLACEISIIMKSVFSEPAFTYTYSNFDNRFFFLQKALQGYVIAKLYFKIGEFRTALKHVAIYLKVKPNAFLAWTLQGECYEKLGRANEAVKSYEKALHLAEKKKNVKRQDLSSILLGIKENVATSNKMVIEEEVRDRWKMCSRFYRIVIWMFSWSSDEPRLNLIKFPSTIWTIIENSFLSS